MPTTYLATLSGESLGEKPQAEFATILDCVKWAEGYGLPAERCDIHNAESGNRVAQYRRPKPDSYPAACGVWVNAKIY